LNITPSVTWNSQAPRTSLYSPVIPKPLNKQDMPFAIMLHCVIYRYGISIFIVEQSRVTVYGQNTKHVLIPANSPDNSTALHPVGYNALATFSIEHYLSLLAGHRRPPIYASYVASNLTARRQKLNLNSAGMRFPSLVTPPMELPFCHVIPPMIPLQFPTNQLPQLETLLAGSLLRLLCLTSKWHQSGEGVPTPIR